MPEPLELTEWGDEDSDQALEQAASSIIPAPGCCVTPQQSQGRLDALDQRLDSPGRTRIQCVNSRRATPSGYEACPNAPFGRTAVFPVATSTSEALTTKPAYRWGWLPGKLSRVAATICSAASLGYLIPPDPAQAASRQTVEVVQTSSDLSEHLTRLSDRQYSPRPLSARTIDVDDRVTYQRFSGLGGSMTDSSAWLFSQLGSQKRTDTLRHLFTAAGLNMTFVRIPLGASDFSVKETPYSYDDMPPHQSDPALQHFSISHDLPYIIPILNQLRNLTGGKLEFEANTWTAPAWMKTNGSLNALNSEGLRGALRPEAYGPFARYLVMALQAFATHGIGIQDITLQNEPGLAPQSIESVQRSRGRASYPGMLLALQDQIRLLDQFLQPALNAAHLSPKIYGNDASWDRASYTMDLVKQTGRSISGVAWHCYAGTPMTMSWFHKVAPWLDQIVNECSPEIKSFSPSEAAIFSLRNWARMVAMWNDALDSSGGPVQPPNTGCGGCGGIVTIDPSTQHVTYGAKYYQLAQLGHYIHPGAQRIQSNTFVSYGNSSVSSGLDDVAFHNPTGTDVLVTYNNSAKAVRSEVEYRQRFFAYTSPSHATTTFIWRAASR